LAVVLAIAAIVNLAVLTGLDSDVLSVFDRALARSTVLAIVPLSLLWFLDRRERESPLLFASAFLWGGCIATGLALPFNTAFLHFADVWESTHSLAGLGPTPPRYWQPRSRHRSSGRYRKRRCSGDLAG
jgi:hypothetical protein